MSTAPDWHAADRAYQLHHATCPTCRADGANPNHLQRCPTGAPLWATYQAAGMPRISPGCESCQKEENHEDGKTFKP